MVWDKHQSELWARKKINDDKTWEWYTNFVGQRMQHNYWEYNIVGQTLMDNPQIRGIVEIGTGCGGLTMLLGLWGVRLGIPVVTVETVHALYKPIEKVLDKLGVEVYNKDCFIEPMPTIIYDFIADFDPVYLVCDGGDKPKELITFGPSVGEGGLVSAHDWECEVLPSDIKPLYDVGFVPWKEEQWTEKNVQFITLQRKELK